MTQTERGLGEWETDGGTLRGLTLTQSTLSFGFLCFCSFSMICMENISLMELSCSLILLMERYCHLVVTKCNYPHTVASIQKPEDT